MLPSKFHSCSFCFVRCSSTYTRVTFSLLCRPLLLILNNWDTCGSRARSQSLCCLVPVSLLSGCLSSITNGKATILDNSNEKLGPPLPPISMMGKWACFGFCGDSSLIRGEEGGSNFSFYSVQDCRSPIKCDFFGGKGG